MDGSQDAVDLLEGVTVDSGIRTVVLTMTILLFAKEESRLHSLEELSIEVVLCQCSCGEQAAEEKK